MAGTSLLERPSASRDMTTSIDPIYRDVNPEKTSSDPGRFLANWRRLRVPLLCLLGIGVLAFWGGQKLREQAVESAKDRQNDPSHLFQLAKDIKRQTEHGQTIAVAVQMLATEVKGRLAALRDSTTILVNPSLEDWAQFENPTALTDDRKFLLLMCQSIDDGSRVRTVMIATSGGVVESPLRPDALSEHLPWLSTAVVFSGVSTHSNAGHVATVGEPIK